MAVYGGVPVIKCDTGSMPPVLCLACLAYINPFAGIDVKMGLWMCPLCGHENVVPKKEIYESSQIMTAMTSSTVEYHQMVSADEDSDSEEKKEDGSIANYGNFEGAEDDYCTYLFVVDENLSPKDGQAIAPAIQAILKEKIPSGDLEVPQSKIRIGLIVFGKQVLIYRLGLSGLSSADIYAPSDSEDDDDEFLGEMKKRSYVVEVQSGDLTSLRNALSSTFGIAVDKYADESSNSAGIFSSRTDMLSQKKAARLRKEESGNDANNNLVAKSPWLKRREEKLSGNAKRCTSVALQCAFDLVSVSSSNPSRTTRIILFTNGCPNIGDGSVVNPNGLSEKSKKNGGKQATWSTVDTVMLQGAVEYYDAAANLGVSAGVGIDVFCCGVTELALPVYQAMVEPSGGYVLPLVSLDTPQLEHNLKHILVETYISRSKDIPEEMNDMMSGPECILDLRSDSFVTPVQFFGPCQVLSECADQVVDTESSAFEEGLRLADEKGFKIKNLPSKKARELSMTRLQMGRVDPWSTITIMLEVDDSISEEDDYAFFQLVSRYLSPNGDTQITRVSSFKIPVAEDTVDFLGSVNDEAMSVVLAKTAVYRSLYGRDEDTDDDTDLSAAADAVLQEELARDTQLDLDATIQRISGAYRLLDLEKSTQRKIFGESGSEKETSDSSLDFAFPPQLKEMLNRLYHLRRGHLISPGPMQSMDDRAKSRGLLIRFPIKDCLQMMRPSIWSTGSMNVSSGWDEMQPFPAETLALWDDSIIAADLHDTLVVWSGVNCTASRYDGIREKFREKLLDISKNRFPMPEVHELKDGDSMSRRFTPRLAPSHADPIDNQIVQFPQLSTLDPAALADLRSKFKFYDSKSDASFRTWFWSVSSASNSSRMEGMSLCE